MLLGRRDEQRAIDALLAAARLGQSGVLVLTGEAGIGKSALLRYADERADGFRVLHVTGTDTEVDLPFAGLAQLLRPLSEQLDRLPAPQADALGVALALHEGESVDRFAVSAGVLNLLTTAAEDGPLGLIIDDGHLVDRPSAEAIVFTCRRLLADPVFVLVAAREDTEHPWLSAGIPRFVVPGLIADVAAELAAASAPVHLAREQQQLVVDLAGGNPLAIRELAREPAQLSELSPGVPIPVSAVLARAFGHRTGALDVADQTVLLVAAVADGDLPVVARVCEAAGLDLAALEHAELIGLLRVSVDHVQFSHSLMRSAVYAAASAAERRRIHRLVAEALPVGDLDRRAWHRCASVLGADADVAGDIEAVGQRARARGADAVAASAFERAARLSPVDQERARRFLAAGRAAWFAGQSARALGLLREAIRHDPSPQLSAQARAVEGLIMARGGSLLEAREILLGAARAAEDGAADQALLMYADAVDVCFYLLDVPTASAAADRAERLLERTSGGSSDVSDRSAAVASIAIGMARIFAGESGTDQIRTGVVRLAELGDAADGPQSAWEVLGPLFLRESSTGRELIAQAVERRRAAASIGTLPHLLYHLARDDVTTDHWSRGAAAYGEAVALAREFGQTTELGASLAGLTWVTARQGRVSECRTLAGEAAELGARLEFRVVTAWVRFGLAELDLSLGAVAAAIDAFRDLDTWLEGIGMHDVDLSPVPELVEALCRAGLAEEADQVAGTYLARAEHKGQPWSLARAARVRGLLAASADFDACFDEALTQHSRTLDTFEEARTRLAYGERLRRTRRRLDARTQLQAALSSFEQLGAVVWADVAVGELNATGLSVRRRETGPVVDLTAREFQIALLLAEGKTTREAAAALFLSPKTVEYHLRHVYTKLDIGSRAELAEALRNAPS